MSQGGSGKERELDELTLKRAQRGDQRAFRVLVERYHLVVHQLLWRMAERPCGAACVEELTQETFLRVFRALPRFKQTGAARLSTWILTIATRLALNELRRSGRAVPLEGEPESPGRERPDRTAERRRRAEIVVDAIAALPPDRRAVIVLREYHGLEYAEISQTLGVDLGTVKSRLSRARSSLRAALSEVIDER